MVSWHTESGSPKDSLHIKGEERFITSRYWIDGGRSLGANSPTVSHPAVSSNSHQPEPNISSKGLEDLRKSLLEKKQLSVDEFDLWSPRQCCIINHMIPLGVVLLRASWDAFIAASTNSSSDTISSFWSLIYVYIKKLLIKYWWLFQRIHHVALEFGKKCGQFGPGSVRPQKVCPFFCWSTSPLTAPPHGVTRPLSPIYLHQISKRNHNTDCLIFYSFNQNR